MRHNESWIAAVKNDAMNVVGMCKDARKQEHFRSPAAMELFLTSVELAAVSIANHLSGLLPPYRQVIGVYVEESSPPMSKEKTEMLLFEHYGPDWKNKTHIGTVASYLAQQYGAGSRKLQEHFGVPLGSFIVPDQKSGVGVWRNKFVNRGKRRSTACRQIQDCSVPTMYLLRDVFNASNRFTIKLSSPAFLYVKHKFGHRRTGRCGCGWNPDFDGDYCPAHGEEAFTVDNGPISKGIRSKALQEEMEK